MTTSKEEYNSLRQEILNHQNNRLTVLGLALPVTAALIAAGVQFNNPYLLLIPPFLLLAVRVLLVNIHAGIQRISAYIRVVLEEDPELKWEKASYFARSESTEEGASVKNISSLKPYDYLLGISGGASIILALIVSGLKSTQQGWPTPVFVLIISFVWLLAWSIYWVDSVREWESMIADNREANKMIEFRNSLPKKRTPRK